jgi:uncharacterized membrane protein YhaH (DUF805 family)
MPMLGAVKYALSNLTNLHGRDARQTFWYWVLAVYIAAFALSLVVTIPSMIAAMGEAFQTATRNPDNPAAIEAVMNAQMSGMISSTMWLSLATSAATLLLLAASTVRRLHDSDLSGWWALVPGGVQLAVLVLMPAQIANMTQLVAGASGTGPNLAADPYGVMFTASGLLAWLPWIALIALGVRKSSEGANRYGETSVSY